MKTLTEKPILISWIAWRNDYSADDTKINPTGPNHTIHQYYFDQAMYQTHILLSAAESKKSDGGKSEKLEKYLNHTFGEQKHRTALRYMNIANVIDLAEIIAKVQPILLEHTKVPVDVFISPGTPMMQVAWMLLYMANVIPSLRLIQGVEASKTSSHQPEFTVMHVEQSDTLRALFVKSTEMEASISLEKTFFLSPVLEPVYRQAQLVAAVPKREVTILIQGESGTGKENLAHYLHENSERKQKPFMAVNCAAISAPLLESRLFGYKKGAFTGANQDQKGLFEACHGGTLFLDEIGDISPEFQQSLLRVLQEGTIYPVGSNEALRIDVKVITATHRNLRKLCEEGMFRWDLFYRLTTVELQLPSLRQYPSGERQELITHLLRTRAAFFERKVLKFQKPVWEQLLSYPFPGNIRELIHLLDRWYIFCSGEVGEEDIPTELIQCNREYSWKMEDVYHSHILKTLAFFNFNRTRTKNALGISYNTLNDYIKKYSIEDPTSTD